MTPACPNCGYVAPRKEIPRNQEIIALFQNGDTLKSIGAKFGVTRERVRQIVFRSGNPPRRVIKAKSKAEKLLAVAAQVAEASNSVYGLSQIAEKIGVSPHWVREAAQRHGIAIKKNCIAMRNSAKVEEAADLVRGGLSLAKACKQVFPDGPENCQWVVAQNLRNSGFIITRHGRHNRDFAARHAAIARKIENGKITWSQLAADVSAAEGKTVRPIWLCAWAKRHGYSSPGKKQAKPKPARRQRDTATNGMIRAKCLALRGNLSAREISKALGITRNAVIGHWYRAKKSGQLSPSQPHEAAP